MKLSIEPTDEVEVFGEELCRIWRGQDEAGRPCIAYVRAIYVDPESLAEFNRDNLLIPVISPFAERINP